MPSGIWNIDNKDKFLKEIAQIISDITGDSVKIERSIFHDDIKPNIDGAIFDPVFFNVNSHQIFSPLYIKIFSITEKQLEIINFIQNFNFSKISSINEDTVKEMINCLIISKNAIPNIEKLNNEYNKFDFKYNTRFFIWDRTTLCKLKTPIDKKIQHEILSNNSAFKQKKIKENFISSLNEEYHRKKLVLVLGAGVSQSFFLPDWKKLVQDIYNDMLRQELRKYTNISIDLPIITEHGFSEPSFIYAEYIQDHLLDSLYTAISKHLYKEKSPDVEIKNSLNRILNSISDIKDSINSINAFIKEINRSNNDQGGKGDEDNNSTSEISESTNKISESTNKMVNLVKDLKELMDKKKGLYKKIERSNDKIFDTIGRMDKVRTIITYNYDDLLEEFNFNNYNVITSGNMGKSPDETNVYHIHGFIPNLKNGRPIQTDIIFSDDDYYRLLCEQYHWANIVQISHFRKYTCLFLGVSLQDPNIRRLLKYIHAENPNNFHYLIKRELKKDQDSKITDPLLINFIHNFRHKLIEKSYRKMGIKIIWIDRNNYSSNVIKILNKIMID